MKRTILGLRAETSVHAGTGQNTGVIDLPIQREAHTDWPCVFGSSVKGALRAHAELAAGWEKARVEQVFGKEDATEASAVAVSDARLLLLPVRSLTGHFRLLTCPAVLRRLARDLELAGVAAQLPVPDPDPEQVVAPAAGDEEELFLEEFRFRVRHCDLAPLSGLLARFGAEEAARRLLVVDDDGFAWFARHATAVTPHIAIDNATKTVRSGALWYEESLPPETLLYTLLMGSEEAVDGVVGMFEERPFVRIGGNETVGMGWCRVTEVRDGQE